MANKQSHIRTALLQARHSAFKQPPPRCYTIRSYSSTMHGDATRKKKARSAPSVPAENRPMRPQSKVDIHALLSKPTWSVESLLPTPEQTLEEYPVAFEKLRHLLRLSALPEPETAEEEAKMLDTLASQLHFVKKIQKVDTTGVEPLRNLRDETESAEKENEITLDTLKEALAQEDVVGRYHKRIRRRQEKVSSPDNPEGWNPLDHAQRKVGKYFVVDKSQCSTT